MIPYGIVIKENRQALQKSCSLWQRKFGFLSFGRFIKESFLSLIIMVAVFIALLVITDQDVTIVYAGIVAVAITGFYLYSAVVRTVRDFAQVTREKNIQLVLKEDTIEITTEYSRETVPYNEIFYCIEKDFIITLIIDKHSMPVSVPKMNVLKGNYDTFASLLRSKIADRYEKKGDM